MGATEDITVSIPSDIMELVRARISAGAYGSEGEVAREAMRRWWERERKQAAFEAEIEKGVADVRAGRTIPIEQVMEETRVRFSTSRQSNAA